MKYLFEYTACLFCTFSGVAMLGGLVSFFSGYTFQYSYEFATVLGTVIYILFVFERGKGDE